MKLTIEEIQKITNQIVKEVTEICKDHQITYYLAYGSVIGAIRHNGPIPWDKDVDIILPINEMDDFVNTMREQLSDKFYVDYYDINETYPGLFPRIGLKGYSTKELHVDIFKLVGVAKNEKEQMKFTRWTRILTLMFKAKQRGKEYFRNKFDWLLLPVLKFMLLPISTKTIINKFEKLCSKYPYHEAEFVVNPNEGYYGKEVLPKSYYGDGKDSIYSHIDVNIPEEYDRYLHHFYGNYMELPSDEEREIKKYYQINKS